MTMYLVRRRIVARVALAMTAVAAIWTGVLFLHGGFDTSLFGVRIRTNDPVRPMFLAFAALLIFVAAVGEGESDPAMSRVADFPRQLLARVGDRVPAFILAVGIVAVGLTLGSKAAGGSDSYGYVSQAELWLSGRLDVPQPWVGLAPWPAADQSFAPLGYHPGTTPATIVPSYSPGLPMLMALAKLIGGQRAIFWVIPLCGGVFVLATFGIGRRLGGSSNGLIAAWLLATSPPLLFMLMAPMSDVPAAAAWTVTFWCVTTGTMAFAVAGGLAAAVAVLIRPNLAPLVSVAVLWFILEARRDRPNLVRYLRQGAAFLAALLPGILITAALNQRWYGSPLTSGYGTAADIFSAANFLPSLKDYTRWVFQTQTPIAFLGMAALLVPARWLWTSRPPRATVLVLGVFVAAVWLEYCAYRTFGAWWWDLRFLLPTWGFMMVGIAVVVLRATSAARTMSATRNDRVVSLAAVLALFLLGLHGIQMARRERAFDQQMFETKYPVAAAIVAARTDPNAVILSGLHSGSLRYYAGRITINYFNLDPAWLHRAAVWLSSHGAHPYALLEQPEVNDFKNRFVTRSGDADQIELKPVLLYDGPTKIYFFDLARAPGTTTHMETIVEPSPEVRVVSPVKPPTLTLK